MYAIIETGGKQYKVTTDDVVFVEKLSAKEDETINFDVVAMSVDDDGLKFGDPFVKDAKVEGKILKNGKGKKITVFTYKPKKGSKRKMGHRQPYSKVVISEISYKDIVAKSTTKDEPKVSKKPTAKKETKATSTDTKAKASTAKKATTTTKKTTKTATTAKKTTTTAKKTTKAATTAKKTTTTAKKTTKAATTAKKTTKAAPKTTKKVEKTDKKDND